MQLRVWKSRPLEWKWTDRAPPVRFYFLLTVRVRRSFFPPPPRVRFEGPFTGSDFDGPFGIRAGKRTWIENMVRRKITSATRVHEIGPGGSGVIQGIETEMMVKEGSQVGPMSTRGIQVGRGSMKECPKWDEKVKFFPPPPRVGLEGPIRGSVLRVCLGPGSENDPD